MTANNILVTGASGFVGRALIKYLSLSWKGQIHAVSRQAVDFPAGVNRFLTDFTKSDQSLTSALESVDIVVHLAARAHLLKDSVADPLYCFREVNVDATLRLASLAVETGMKRFVFISSIGVYGGSSTTAFNEQTSCNPHTDYAVSKLEAEQQLMQLAEKLNFELVIIRPVLVYGDNAPGNFGKLVKLISKTPILPFGLVDNRRSFISVDRLAVFICLCAQHPNAANQDFVIADNPSISTLVLINSIAEALGEKAIQLPIPVFLMKLMAKLLGRSNMAEQLFGNLEVDTAKANRLLGWNSMYPISQGLSGLRGKK